MDNLISQFLHLAQTFIFLHLFGLLTIGYFYRRKARLSGKPPVFSEWGGVVYIVLPVLLAVAINVAASVVLDNHWDNLRNQYSLPTGSVDFVILVKLSNAGLTAVVLALLVGLIELYDWLRARVRLRAAHTQP